MVDLVRKEAKEKTVEELSESFTPTSQVKADTGNGHGSSATFIRRFSNSSAIGSAITFNDSSTQGSTFTVNEDGVYTIDYVDRYNTAALASFAITVNAKGASDPNGSGADQTTVSSGALSDTSVLLSYADDANSRFIKQSATARLNAGDVIRAHTDGDPNNTSAYILFRVTQVAKT